MSIISYISDTISYYFSKPIEPTKRYNLLHKTGTNHLANAPDFSELAANPVTFSLDEAHDFTSVHLTAAQALFVAEIVAAAGDHFEEEKVFTLPPHRYYTNEVTATAEKSNTDPLTATPGILINIPQYPGTVHGIDVAVLDTLMVINAPPLAGYKVSVGKSFVGTTPCEPHGTNVAEIIAQGFVPENTDIHILNFAVFDCNGSAATSTIVNGVKEILDYKKGHGKDRGLVVNFSGGGPTSPMLDNVFAKLPQNGIGVVVAAGNSGELCTLGSPANISSTSALQSIGALGKKGDPVGYQPGQDLATYSNYATPAAKCVDEYYQGCYSVTDPFTNQTAVGCGTSFASPVGTARHVACQNDNPNASIAEIKQIMQQDTVPAIGPQGTAVNALTPTMAYGWNITQQSNAAEVASAVGHTADHVVKKQRLTV